MVDLVCYRRCVLLLQAQTSVSTDSYTRLGHNELDEPAYTNPLSSQRIASLPSVLTIFEKELITDNILTEADATMMKQDHFNSLDKSLAAVENYSVPKFEMPERWSAMRFPDAGEWETEKVETGYDEALLRELGLRSTQVPEDFVRLSLPLLRRRTDMSVDNSPSIATHSHVETDRLARKWNGN